MEKKANRGMSGNPSLDGEVPLGFGMALAQNEQALRNFGSMDERQRQRYLFEARHVRSKEEMTRIVNRIEEHGTFQ